jgi:ABC-type multidrug transport system fused ATPase/permease subunit
MSSQVRPHPRATTKPLPSGAGSRHTAPQGRQLTRLVLQLVRPYRGWLVIVFIAMLAEIAMSLAAPWPLKLVLDDALEHHKLPAWLAWAHDYGIGRSTLGVALFAGLSTLLIALIAAIATYVDNYYTSSVGQWVADDLRIRVWEHLHQLSLRFYDNAKTGALMSTITSDDRARRSVRRAAPYPIRSGACSRRRRRVSTANHCPRI